MARPAPRRAVLVGIGLVLAFLSRLSSYRDQAGRD